MKIILLNAPPRAGKDTAAAAIASALQNIQAAGHNQPYVAALHKMAEPLKDAIHSLFSLKEKPEWYEQNKDTPATYLHGKTLRQLYIWLSEDCVKEKFGKGFFGHVFAKRLRDAERLADAATGQEYLCICSDLGFVEELEPLVAAYGAENILIMKIERPGTNFGNDSRSYIDYPGVRTKTMINRGTVQQLQLTAIKAAHDWLYELQGKPDAETCATA